MKTNHQLKKDERRRAKEARRRYRQEAEWRKQRDKVQRDLPGSVSVEPHFRARSPSINDVLVAGVLAVVLGNNKGNL